jgi:hypothetical protein
MGHAEIDLATRLQHLMLERLVGRTVGYNLIDHHRDSYAPYADVDVSDVRWAAVVGFKTPMQPEGEGGHGNQWPFNAPVKNNPATSGRSQSPPRAAQQGCIETEQTVNQHINIIIYKPNVFIFKKRHYSSSVGALSSRV